MSICTFDVVIVVKSRKQNNCLIFREWDIVGHLISGWQ